MTESSGPLARYLRGEAGRRFALGEADCATFIAGWVQARCGVDPMAHCRGYRGEAEAGVLLTGWGGLVRAVGRGLRQTGIPMTRNPQPGDVAVVAVGNIAACAIRTRRGWALRLDDGLALLPPERVRVIAAWRV